MWFFRTLIPCYDQVLQVKGQSRLFASLLPESHSFITACKSCPPLFTFSSDFPGEPACALASPSLHWQIFSLRRDFTSQCSQWEMRESEERVGHRGTICGKNEATGPTVNKKWNLVSRTSAWSPTWRSSDLIQVWDRQSIPEVMLHSTTYSQENILDFGNQTHAPSWTPAVHQIPFQKSEGQCVWISWKLESMRAKRSVRWDEA